ncbi:uncharacterized protein LOC133414772 [Phycodurus eques]|uniref:uncharacterized protein LOC133414772 n=1 Tax=Phycodurus eques TaxID=693459 RepID=UPI002ACE32AB|nr:uncharacterized protein LOC133414772 [Phycodurus eques]
MEAVPSEPSVMAVDLSKSFSAAPRTRNHHAPASDLAAKPEWYRRHPAGLHIDSSYRSGSYDGGAGMEPSYMSAALPTGVYRDGDLWCPSFYQADASREDDSDSGSDVIVLLAAAKEPLLCASFVADGVRPIAQPLSPPPSSPGCCERAQNLTSQSSDTSSEEEEEEDEVEESESSADIPPHHARPIVLLANLSADHTDASHFDTARFARTCGTRSDPAGRVLSHTDMSSDDSDVIEVPVTRKRPTFPPNRSQDKTAAVECKRSNRIRASSKQAPLPTWPVRYRLARSVKKDTVGVYYENCDSDDTVGYASDDDASRCHTKSESDDSCQRRARNKSHDDGRRPTTDKSDNVRQCHKAGETDDAHRRHAADKSDNSHQRLAANRTGKVQHHVSESDDARQRHATNKSDHSHQHRGANKSDNSHRRRATNKSADAQISSTKQKLSSSAKRAVKRQRRKRRAWCPPSSLFSPPEPEIKLKCTAAKEPTKKKKKTSDVFCPFVRVRQRANAQRNEVTVVNRQDHQDVMHDKQSAARSSSGVIPKTSCFRLGRLTDFSTGSDATQPLCCLCGHVANANGLGDLHGPYLPMSHSLAKLSDSRDTDTALPNLRRHLDERWVHSDCSVWSSQVFLVRGNLYGLEEAEQLARATMCCWCQRSGAIMGCSHKGCTGYFHYTCSLFSGCALNEDNLSLRCSQHNMTKCQQLQRQGHTQRKSWRAARRRVR